jgi:hypothetical protein
MWWFPAVAVMTGVAFLGYGAACLWSERMHREFRRFGLHRYRAVIGLLEVSGGAGLLFGLWYLPLLAAAASSIALLMFLVVIARLRLGDRWSIILPAVALCLVNGLLACEAWRRMDPVLL